MGTRRLRRVALVAVLALLAVGAFVLIPRGTDPGHRRDPERPAPGSPAEPPSTQKTEGERQTPPAASGDDRWRVIGRVLASGTGRGPASGAEVTIRSESGGDAQAALDPLAARADPDGRFSIDGVQAGILLKMEIDHPGCAIARIRVELPVGSEERVEDLGDIVLRSATSLVVRVVDPDDEPVVDAKVVAREGGSAWWVSLKSLWQEASARGGGDYLFERIGWGRSTIFASAPGHGWARENIPLPRTGPYVIQLAESAHITGTVRANDEKPIEGARITARARSEDEAPIESRTDATGRFALDVPEWIVSHPERYVMLTASAPGFVPAEKRIDERLEEVDLWLWREAIIAGRVVSEGDGKPIRGACIYTSATLPALSYADADARFEVRGIPPGEISLEVDHDDYIAVCTHPFDVREGSRIVGIEVRLARGLSISGMVTDAQTQAAIAGATVRAQLAQDEIEYWEWRSAESDSQGAFVIHGLRDAEYWLSAEAGGYLRDGGESRVTPASSPVSISLRRGASVTGRVIDDGGAPVCGAWVVVYDEGRSIAQAITDESGGFAFDALPSSTGIEIAAEHEGYVEGRVKDIALQPPEAAGPLEIRLERGGSIQGKISLPPGWEKARVAVDARPWSSGEGGAQDSPGWSPRFLGTVEKSLEYSISGLPPGDYTVSADADLIAGPPSRRIHIERGETVRGVDFAFEQGETVSGLVIDDLDRPIEGVEISVDGDAQTVSGSTDAEGRFRFAGLRPGRASIYATGGGAGDRQIPIRVPSQDIRIRLARLATLKGRLLGRDAFHTISISPLVAQKIGDHWPIDLEADPQGRFAARLEPGEYTIRAQVPGHVISTTDMALRPGESRELTIQLERAGRILGRVMEDSTGEPIEGATVFVDDPSGLVFRAISLHTNAEGKFELDHVPPGPVTLIADRMGYGFGRVSGVFVQPGQTVEATIPMRTGRGILGEVASFGKPCAGARIRVRLPNGEWIREGIASACGIFEFADLPAGEYEVEIQGNPVRGGTIRVLLSVTIEEDGFSKIDVELRIRVTGRLSSGASPIANAEVLLRGPAGEKWGETSAEEDGSFEVFLPGTGTCAATIRLESGEEFERTFAIPEGASEFEWPVDLSSP